MRNGGDESGENLTLGPVTQWKYGKRGERHYFEHNGREITATFKPLHACTIRHPNIKADDDTLPFGGKSARTLSQTYRLFL
jgi:hypothetical protein